MGYLRSSEGVGRRRLVVRLGLLLGLSPTLWACATVRPQDKEYLSDPAMTYGSGGQTEIQDEHVLTNREGAAGAGSASGGGCGCN